MGGEIIGAWILNPVSNELYVAARGSGAYRNQERITTRLGSPGIANLCGVAATRFMPPDMQSDMKHKLNVLGAVKPLMLCAGTEYPDVADGERHFALYWRVLPWDHAPGALFLTEAGGYVARLSGDAYKVSEQLPGLLVARNQDIWRDAQSALRA